MHVDIKSLGLMNDHHMSIGRKRSNQPIQQPTNDRVLPQSGQAAGIRRHHEAQKGAQGDEAEPPPRH